MDSPGTELARALIGQCIALSRGHVCVAPEPRFFKAGSGVDVGGGTKLLGRFVLQRMLAAAGVALLVSVGVFWLVRALPGDPVTLYLGQSMSFDDQTYRTTRSQLGLDEPLPVQYAKWMGRLMRADLGRSSRGQGEVTQAIRDRLPVTAQLCVAAMLIAVLVSFPAGTIAASHRGGIVDRVVTVFAMSGVAMPSFWLAILLVLVFGSKLGWFPVYGFVPIQDGFLEWARHLAMPAFALGISLAGPLTRQVRASLVEVLNEDYIRTARAKGLKRRTVTLQHGLRNALLPVVTVMGLQIGHLLGGAVVIEQVFAIPGMGRLAVQSIIQSDYAVIQGVVLVSAVAVVLANALADLCYGFLDPRVRAS